MEPIFLVQYSDNDREDMDREELEYAMELYIEQTGAKQKSKSKTKVDSGSDKDESYRPSPESYTSLFRFLKKKGIKKTLHKTRGRCLLLSRPQLMMS